MSIESIISGWENYIFENKSVENMAKKRAEICEDCPENTVGNILVFFNDKLQNIKGRYCKECGCPLSAKVRSPNENCGYEKW